MPFTFSGLLSGIEKWYSANKDKNIFGQNVTRTKFNPLNIAPAGVIDVLPTDAAAAVTSPGAQTAIGKALEGVGLSSTGTALESDIASLISGKSLSSLLARGAITAGGAFAGYKALSSLFGSPFTSKSKTHQRYYKEHRRTRREREYKRRY